ncbi:MAG: hypothetical protein HY402_07085 [Elusimicrobia bacterium]|nr:hypothetical protein [Elusimicrobiota bacterium]
MSKILLIAGLGLFGWLGGVSQGWAAWPGEPTIQNPNNGATVRKGATVPIYGTIKPINCVGACPRPRYVRITLKSGGSVIRVLGQASINGTNWGTISWKVTESGNSNGTARKYSLKREVIYSNQSVKSYEGHVVYVKN